MASLLLISNVNAQTFTSASTPEYDENAKIFFANGTNITVAQNPSGEGAIITWNGGSQIVPADASIFGGSHAKEGILKTSTITMTGGKVKNIVGGGLHKSQVDTTTINIKAGTITGSVIGGGGSSFSGTTCHRPWYASDATNATTRVNTANVTIDGGSIFLLYGGGEGISYTGKANVKINNGKINYVTAGGSNGMTSSADLKINGGTIQVVQSVNRGSMDTVGVEVTGGKIENLYVGGETGDSSVTGTLKNADIKVTGGNVTKLEIGKSGGNVIPNTNDKMNVSYIEGTVQNIDESQYNEVEKYINITIDGKSYTIKKGMPLSSLEKINDIKTKKGYTFKKFVTKNNEEFPENTIINTSVELKTVFESQTNETIKNPETTDNIILYIVLFISAVGLLGYLVKNYRKSYNN